MHRELRIVLAGERVELASTRDDIEHVGEVGHRADGFGEGLDLLHELGVLDFVQRAAAIGELHTGLELAVALAGSCRFPLAGLGVQAFDKEGLAAGSARGRKVHQRHLAADRRFERQRGDRVDQRVDARGRPLDDARLDRHRRQRNGGHRRHRALTVEHRLARLAARLHHRGALRPGATRLPGTMRDDAGEHHAAERSQRDGEVAHHRRHAITRLPPC